MLAVDTNVLVRLVTRDDPDQARKAFALFERERLWIGKTVLLETEWVLRYSYQLDRETILKALRGLAGLKNVELEDPLTVARALDWFEAGLDFADALHLAASRHTGGFISFDQRLIKRAARLEAVDSVEIRTPI